MSRYASFKDAKKDLANNPNAVRDFLNYEVRQYVGWKHALRDIKAESKDIQQKDLWDKELIDFSSEIKKGMHHLEVLTYTVDDYSVFMSMKLKLDSDRFMGMMKCKCPHCKRSIDWFDKDDSNATGTFISKWQMREILESLSETKIREIFGEDAKKYCDLVPYSLMVDC